MDSRLWLSHAVNSILDSGGTPLKEGAGFTECVDTMSALNGFDQGEPVDRVTEALVAKLRIEFNEMNAVNLVMHGLHLGLSILGHGERRDLALELVACCAFVVNRLDDAHYCLAQRGEGKTVSHDRIADIAQDLLKRDLDLDDTLSGHPMAHLRMWSDYRLFGELAICIRKARSEPGGQPGMMDVYRSLGSAENRLRRALSMCIALTHADGVVDEEESILLGSLTKLARIGEQELAVVRSEYKTPMPLEALAHVRMTWVERRFLYLLLYISAYINGRHHPSESDFIKEFASYHGDDESVLEVLESEALVYFESHHEFLRPGVAAGFLGVIRASLHTRFESALKQNGRRLVAELGETKELVQLMGQAVKRPLTKEEEKRARAQLVDLMKTVPALAVFALPGGAFLLPMVIKYLRLELRPSNFKDDVELGDPHEDENT